jgi:hypothetical protein
MPQKTLSLSVDNVKGLIAGLKMLSNDLNDAIKVDIEQATCASIALDVQAGISAIQDVDGNYLGGDPAAVTVEVGLSGHDVIWTGQQIAFLEFGTGAKGAAGGYTGAAMAEAGYQPDPAKTSWGYLNNGQPVTSFSMEPHAPMANAATAMRHVTMLEPARKILEEALLRAVAV